MSEPIELKIGQVWYCHGGTFEVVALGPNFVGLSRPGCLPTCIERSSFEGGRIRLVHPKHELWVNVYRAENGNIHGYVETGTRGALGWCASNLAGARIACLKIEFEEGEGLDDGLTNRT